MMAQGAGAAEPESKAWSLVGTWFTQVSIRNCQTGSEVTPFPALGTFMRGGTLTDTTSAISPALRSPGHGG
ncbi:MAG: hypothetical protein ACR2NN_26990 [Bryobacteraceae bacterium]